MLESDTILMYTYLFYDISIISADTLLFVGEGLLSQKRHMFRECDRLRVFVSVLCLILHLYLLHVLLLP